MAQKLAVTSSAPLPGELDEGPGQLPRVFGRYVLFDRIGRGGMADIFLARADTAFGGSRLCVIKQILAQLGQDNAFERMLIGEAKLAAQLSHANIVQVFDLGRESDRLFIAMEYVEGFDLNQLLRALSDQKLGLPAEFALLIVRETLRGLDYAHRAKDKSGKALGLVHRDVSPSNVLISFEGEVKLCDFGIAKALNAQDERLAVAQNRAPRVVGKSAYMAPEHAMGEGVDARTDLFSAGILLWELCAGRRLYKGSEEQMLALARAAEVPKLPERGLPEPAKLQAVLDKALARSPNERFRSAQEFLGALEDYALSVRLMVSQLRFASFLTEHFGDRILEVRRERERAARSVPSNLPPPPEAGDPSSDSVPTVVAPAASIFPDGESSDSIDTNSAMVRWSEPGASAARRAPASQSARVVAISEAGLPGTALSETELSRSLSGLEALSQETEAVPGTARPSSMIANAASMPAGSLHPEALRREWLWYAAAVAILAIGVAGYLWR
jgi:eukaryotic-like serine/threonine-protein kinase